MLRNSPRGLRRCAMAERTEGDVPPAFSMTAKVKRSTNRLQCRGKGIGISTHFGLELKKMACSLGMFWGSGKPRSGGRVISSRLVAQLAI